MNQAPMFSSAILVEDELALAQTLLIALRRFGMQCWHAATITQARHFMQEEAVDFILLDRTLPDGDGLSFCKELRQNGFTGTILILSASGELAYRVEGLNNGADDYLPKPFSMEELEARLGALSRRAVYRQRPITGPSWTNDPNQLRILGPSGNWVSLTPLEYKLASTLMGRPDQIFSRKQLLKEVWGFSFLTQTRTVDHFLGRLRKYFERIPEEPRHFLTIRGVGYKFTP